MASFHGLVFFCLCSTLLLAVASPTQYKVGGSKGWSVPTDPNAMSYSQWAEKQRFRIGDSLLFAYLPDRDSVLLVNADAYRSCNTSSHVDEFRDGNTVFTFTQSGPFYFISGNRENCLKNESLAVVVLADRNNHSSSAPSPSPPAPSSSPPPSGSVGLVPSSAPAGEGSSSPPPPPNGASAKVVGFMGTIGGFLGSLFFVL